MSLMVPNSGQMLSCFSRRKLQAAKESTASPAKSSPYLAEESLKKGSSLIMVYFTIRAVVPKLACLL